MSVDPNAEKYPGWSPYNYVYNNPLVFFDPNGEDGFYFGVGAGGGIGVTNEGLNHPNFVSGSVIAYRGTNQNGKVVTGSAATGSPGGIFGGSIGYGVVGGYWFGDFSEMEGPSASIGINILGFTFEVIVDGSKSGLELSDVMGIEIGYGGEGVGIGAYATENFTQIISEIEESETINVSDIDPETLPEWIRKNEEAMRDLDSKYNTNWRNVTEE